MSSLVFPFRSVNFTLWDHKNKTKITNPQKIYLTDGYPQNNDHKTLKNMTQTYKVTTQNLRIFYFLFNNLFVYY